MKRPTLGPEQTNITVVETVKGSENTTQIKRPLYSNIYDGAEDFEVQIPFYTFLEKDRREGRKLKH